MTPVTIEMKMTPMWKSEKIVWDSWPMIVSWW